MLACSNQEPQKYLFQAVHAGCHTIYLWLLMLGPGPCDEQATFTGKSANGLCVQKRFWLVVSGMTHLCQESERQGKVLCVVISAEDATWSLVCTQKMLAAYFWPANKRTRSYQQWSLYSGFCGECLGRLTFDVLRSLLDF